MKRLLLALILSLASPAFAESFALGETLNHSLSVCVHKQDAKAMIDAAKVSHEAAKAKWAELDGCVTVPVTGGPTVGLVVYSAEVIREEKKETLKAVEILVDGKVVAYFFTILPVSAKLEVIKPDKSRKNVSHGQAVSALG